MLIEILHEDRRSWNHVISTSTLIGLFRAVMESTLLTHFTHAYKSTSRTIRSTHHTRTVYHSEDPLERRLHQRPATLPIASSKFLIGIQSMSRENRPLVTDALVEFEKQSVQVQDFVQENYRSMWGNLQKNPQI